MKSQKKIKIIFLLPSLVPGGAERVISFVAQNIDKDKFEPTLLIAGYKKNPAYDVTNVNVVYLNKSRILTALPYIILNILKIKPDIVVSSISHVNIAMSAISPLFKKTRFIGREATVLSKRKNEKKLRKWSPVHFMPKDFKNLDMIICQSKDMAEDMITNYHIPKHKICVINNPISNVSAEKNITKIPGIKKLITVGRLAEVKGHLRLLNILSKLKIPFEYTVIGDGSLKAEIFEKAKLLGVLKHIKHIPFTNDVNKYLSNSDLFLQGSYVEGFPNALLESCVVGTPVIAFNVPGGTKEIIVDGVNGFLVDDEEEFLEKLHNTNDWDSGRIRNSVIDKFNQEKIISEYETLFFNIIKTSK